MARLGRPRWSLGASPAAPPITRTAPIDTLIIQLDAYLIFIRTFEHPSRTPSPPMTPWCSNGVRIPVRGPDLEVRAVLIGRVRKGIRTGIRTVESPCPRCRKWWVFERSNGFAGTAAGGAAMAGVIAYESVAAAADWSVTGGVDHPAQRLL